MSNKTLSITDTLYEYILDVSVREPDVLAELRAVTARLPEVAMQIAPEQGRFMALLVQIMNARRCIEVGVFTGYSSLSVALALPVDGSIIACDVSEEWTAVARRYWQKAGVAEKIDLRLAPASETLGGLLDNGLAEQFDFAFIDADKEGYASYYEQLLQLIRPGGLIAVDNVLWSGRVADNGNNEPDTLAIRAFNDRLKNDQRVDISLLPLADGLTLARKRA
jgi:predicted O-methyltransferase YrrM